MAAKKFDARGRVYFYISLPPEASDIDELVGDISGLVKSEPTIDVERLAAGLVERGVDPERARSIADEAYLIDESYFLLRR